jgi:hypothetical protein
MAVGRLICPGYTWKLQGAVLLMSTSKLIDWTLTKSIEKLVTKNKHSARCRWLTSIILATQEAEIKRIAARSQPGQIVRETPSRKTLHKNRDSGVAQGEGPEFKP